MAANLTSFRPGKSGNPGGRPKLVELRDGKTIVDLAREQTESALQTLIDVKDDQNSPAAARVSASIALLDRGWGRPNTPITGDPANPIAFADVTEDAERVTAMLADLGRRQAMPQ